MPKAKWLTHFRLTVPPFSKEIDDVGLGRGEPQVDVVDLLGEGRDGESEVCEPLGLGHQGATFRFRRRALSSRARLGSKSTASMPALGAWRRRLMWELALGSTGRRS